MSLYFRMLQQQRRCMEYFLSIYFLSLLLNLLWRLEDTESLSHKCALQKGQHTPAKFVIIISATFLGGGGPILLGISRLICCSLSDVFIFHLCIMMNENQ